MTSLRMFKLFITKVATLTQSNSPSAYFHIYISVAQQVRVIGIAVFAGIAAFTGTAVFTGIIFTRLRCLKVITSKWCLVSLARFSLHKMYSEGQFGHICCYINARFSSGSCICMLFCIDSYNFFEKHSILEVCSSKAISYNLLACSQTQTLPLIKCLMTIKQIYVSMVWPGTFVASASSSKLFFSCGQHFLQHRLHSNKHSLMHGFIGERSEPSVEVDGKFICLALMW